MIRNTVLLIALLFSLSSAIEVEQCKVKLNIGDTVYFTKSLIPCIVIGKHSFTNVFEYTTVMTWDLERIRPKAFFKKRDPYDLRLGVSEKNIFIRLK